MVGSRQPYLPEADHIGFGGVCFRGTVRFVWVDRRLVLARPDGLGTALCILPERRARDGHNVWDTR